MGTPIIHTIEPENLKSILATHFDYFGFEELRKNMSPDLWGKGILNSDGTFWAHSRALIRPTFNRVQIADFDSFRQHTDRLISLLPRDCSTVDLQPLFKHYILDTSTQFLFGKSVDSQLRENTEENEGFISAFEYTSSGIGRHRHLGRLLFLKQDRKWKQAVSTVHAFVDCHVSRVLGTRKPSSKEQTIGPDEVNERPRYILLNEMAEMTDDPVDLRYQVLHVFMPAHESTGILLGEVFYLLARHPKVWDKLGQEILGQCPEEPTYEVLKNMKYLKYVINETLRVHTLFFNGQRTCLKDIVLPLGGGADGKSPLFIKKGQIVAFDMWSLHKDKDFWGDDAEEFIPERWETARPTWQYLPFNGGPRVCLAQQLVLVETGYVIVRLMQEFGKIENRDEKEWEECLKLSVRSKHGVKVGLLHA